MKKGQYLYFNLVNYRTTISILVCALNSVDFKEQFERKGGEVFKFSLVLTRDIPTSWDLKQKIDKIKGDMVEEEGDVR